MHRLLLQTMDIHKDTANYILNFLTDLGVSPSVAVYLKLVILVLIITIAVVLVDLIVRKFLITFFHQFAARTKSQFDDHLIDNNAAKNLGHILPTILLQQVIPLVFEDFPNLIPVLTEMIDIYIIVLIVLLARSFVRGTKGFLKTKDSFRDKPVDSYTQVINIFLYFLGGVLIFSEITGKDVWTFLTALGAASAILLLVFKDTIMGFVASIQISTFDMVRIGDWIAMEKYGADGDVIEINLTTVKVQNWDMTITTIPTYSLISDSFKNWRGMQRSGGRRIKRSMNIKIGSVRFLKDDELTKFEKIQLISKYVKSRHDDITKFNKDKGADKSILINGRNLTNLGLFRKYLTEYLEAHPAINKDMTLMVRQMEPSDKGIPLEIYAFSSDKRWVNYEYIISDIFDHALASVGYFDLEVFESPAGTDFHKIDFNRLSDSKKEEKPKED